MLHTAYRKDPFTKRKSVLSDNWETPDMSDNPLIDSVAWDTIQAQFQSYQVEIDKISAYAKAVSISSDEDASLNIEEAGKWRKLAKRLEEARKEILEPLRRFTNQVNALVKGYTEPLEKAIGVITAKEGAYQIEKRSTLEAELAAARVLAEYLGQAVHAIEIEPVTNTSTANASTYLRTEWDVELIDIKLVPSEFLELNHSAVKAMIKAGVTEIPGIKITEKQITTLRTK